MPVLTDAKQQAVQLLKGAVGKGFDGTAQDLEIPPDPAMGDFAYPCFGLAKAQGRSPAAIASELSAAIEPSGYVREARAVGPYVNFALDTATFGQAVIEEILAGGADYGKNETGGNRRVLVEYANLNTHKDVHVGHLRNLLVGQVTVNLLRANGADVVPVAYINDLGAHVASCLFALKGKEDEAEDAPDKDLFLGKMYADAVAAMKADPSVKDEVSRIHRDLEEGKGPYYALWKKTRKWSLASLKEAYADFSLEIDKWYFESELIDETKRIIDRLVDQGIAQLSDGAWIVDLEAEGQGVNLLVKSDGTLLYNAKDLALAMRKEEDFQPQQSIYVIDARQSLAMRQLFATLRKMGFEKDLVHLSYEFVTLKDGAMSSRKGNVVRYVELRDAMIASARTETAKRHEDWGDRKVDLVARAVAFSAMRFAMIRQDIEKRIIFDREESLSFDGFTGPYLLYTHARMESLLRKAGKVKPAATGAHLTSGAEHRLLLQAASLPTAVFQAGKTLDLAHLAQYAFDLAKAFAEYYNEVPVLQHDDAQVVRTRLATVAAARQALRNVLTLLAIETVDEM